MYMFSIRKIKTSHILSASPTFVRVIFLVAKSPFCLKYRGVFDSLLKQQLTRYNTFPLIRSCGNEVYKVEKSKEDT